MMNDVAVTLSLTTCTIRAPSSARSGRTRTATCRHTQRTLYYLLDTSHTRRSGVRFTVSEVCVSRK